MPKRPSDATSDPIENRLAALEARIAGAESSIDALQADAHDVRATLAEHGVPAKVVANPAPRKALEPSQRRAIRRQTAARARAGKPVGKGCGAVKTPETKRRLEQQAGVAPTRKPRR